MESCLYRGHVRHRRGEPEHQFRYSTAWGYLDLSEIGNVFESCRLLSHRRFAPLSFRREDHFGTRDETVECCVRKHLEEETGQTFDGPIRLLTQFRQFGMYFSPLNVFYCFDQQDNLRAMIAEVTNTPWNEKHTYVLWDGNRVEGSQHRYAHPKGFHVSPFMGMESEYQWRLTPPNDSLDLSIGSVRDGKRLFHADLHLHRVPMSDGQLLRSFLRYPVAAMQILGAIYGQAFRLWMKKCQFYPHPQIQPKPSLDSTLSPRTFQTSDSPGRR